VYDWPSLYRDISEGAFPGRSPGANRQRSALGVFSHGCRFDKQGPARPGTITAIDVAKRFPPPPPAARSLQDQKRNHGRKKIYWDSPIESRICPPSARRQAPSPGMGAISRADDTISTAARPGKKTNFAGDTPSSIRNLGNGNFSMKTNFRRGWPRGLTTRYLVGGCGFFGFRQTDRAGPTFALQCQVYSQKVETAQTEAGHASGENSLPACPSQPQRPLSLDVFGEKAPVP